MSVLLRRVSRKTIRQLLSETNTSSTLSQEEQEIVRVVDGLLKMYCDSGKNNYIDLQFIDENKAQLLMDYIFKSNKRSIKDVFFIVRYLALFDKFITAIKDDSVELFDLLISIAKGVERETSIANCIIHRIGDNCDRCYLLMKGSVAVLQVKECKMKLNRNEYISHLETLHALNEHELLSLTINANAYINTYWNVPLHLQNVDNAIKPLITTKTNTNMFTQHLNQRTFKIINVNDYIMKLTPCSNNSERLTKTEQAFEIELFVYEHLCDLHRGDIFNEMVLCKHSYNETPTTTTHNSKYMCSYITITPCECISLSKRIYAKSLKQAKLKQRNTNVSYLLSNTLFLHVNASIFDKYYFSFFKPHTFYLGDYIYNQNDVLTNIIIIKEGEIELSLKTSFNFLEKLISLYGGKATFNNFFDNIADRRRCVACIGDKVSYHKFYVIKKREIFGLDDVLYDEGKVLFNAKVVSSKCKVFMIDVKVFEKIVMKDKFVLWNKRKVVMKRKELFLEKMFLIRKVLINQYKFLKGTSSEKIKEEMKKIEKDVEEGYKEQGRLHYIKKSQSLSPLRFPVMKYTHNNNNNNNESSCCNGNSNSNSNNIRFRNKREEYLPRFTNSSLRSVLCCTNTKSKDEYTFEHNNDKDIELISTNENNNNNNMNINCNSIKTNYTSVFNNNNNNNTQYSPTSYKQDALVDRMRSFKYRKSNTLNTFVSPVHSSINNTTFNSKDESTSPRCFPKNNSCLFQTSRHVCSMESIRNENILLSPRINSESINVNTILSEMDVLSKESERLRVRKNPMNIQNINNKDVIIQHLLMHKIGKDVHNKHNNIITPHNQRQHSSMNIMKQIDFLAMDRFVELVQGHKQRIYKPKQLNCKIKKGLNCFIKNSNSHISP